MTAIRGTGATQTILVPGIGYTGAHSYVEEREEGSERWKRDREERGREGTDRDGKSEGERAREKNSEESEEIRW